MLSNRPIALGGARPGVVGNVTKKVAFSSDENAIARAAKGSDNTSINKTPATKSTRRAFGDISNRKNDGAPANKSASFRSQTPFVAKPKTAASNKPSVRKTPFQSSTANIKRRTEINIPDESSRLQNLGTEEPRASTILSREKPKLDDSWFLEEPEKPYGMLYNEQILSWDTDDGSVISLEGVGHLKENMKEAAERGRQLYIESIENDIKQQIQAFDEDINDFNKKDDEVPPPADSDIISYLDDLEAQLSTSDSINESFHRVNISFG